MSAPPVRLCIFDLDGLLLNVESIVTAAASAVLARLDPPASLTPAALAASRGRRPLDAWAQTAAVLGLDPSTAPALLSASEALLRDRWHTCPPMPGALRLVAHLRAAGVACALATSTPRATYAAKTGPGSAAPALGPHAWDAVICGDDPAVKKGKPAPDAFLAAAAAAGGVPPSACLVLEDAPAGAEAAVAAGMRCVVVPSLTDADGAASAFPAARGVGAPAGVTESLPSLFAFDPSRYGLPPFTDALPVGPHAGCITSAIPFWPGPDAFRLRGRVVHGFGRGSKQLGIPTANLPPGSLAGLADAVTGIYACWAVLGDGCDRGAGVAWPAVASIGFNPQFVHEVGGTPQRTAEPWILAPPGALPDQFYGADLRLLVVSYLRPEARFEGLDALVAQIHADAAAARVVLASAALVGAADDEFLR